MIFFILDAMRSWQVSAPPIGRFIAARFGELAYRSLIDQQVTRRKPDGFAD